MKTHLIGVDPSFQNCGIAIYCPATKELKLHTGDIFSAIKFVTESGLLSKSIAIIENPNLDSNTFGMWAFFKQVLTGNQPIKNIQGQFGICMKRAQDIGKSKASAEFLIEMFRRQYAPVIEVKPSSRDRADKVKNADVRLLKMPTKTTAAQFLTYCGFATKTGNEHSRDAGTLVAGRTIEWAERQLALRRTK